MLRTLIVDDEQAARDTLKDLLTEFCPDVELIGVAADIQSARQVLDSQEVDVLFLDIQMPGGGGFDLLNEMVDRPFQVVFVTGYEQYAIRAIRLNAMDYLLKPVRVPELTQTMVRLRSRPGEHSAQQRQLIHQLLRQYREGGEPEFITLKDLNGFDMIRISEIIYLKGERNYTHITTEGNREFTSSRTLKHYEEMLPPRSFIRIHKSFIVNAHHVRRYHHNHSGYVLMSNGSRLDVSRRRLSQLLDCISELSSG